MTHRSLTRIAIATAALGALAVAPTAAPGKPAESAAALRITADGVGKVKLGKTFQRLRDQGLVGRLRPGCELSGPGTRVASLKPPLRGEVNFTRTSPRRAKHITILGGDAKARGVGIGATIRQIRDAFPKARVDHGTDGLFGVTLVKIPRDGGGKMRFAVDVDTHKTTMIGVPIIPFCE
jgi:hypothetical protein